MQVKIKCFIYQTQRIEIFKYLGDLVSISSKTYTRLFRTRGNRAAFSSYISVSRRQNLYGKCARKTLMKLMAESKTVSRAISSENVLLKPAFINSFPRRSGTFNQGKWTS